jgi:drug/metabolite transporter (DMT)-like permease
MSVLFAIAAAVGWGSSNFAAGDIAWGLAAGVAGGGAAMLLFMGLGKGSTAVVAPVTATGAASIPVLFGIVTGDPVTAFSILGIAMALVAIVLVSLTGGDDGRVADPVLEGPSVLPDGWSDEFRLPPPAGSPSMAPPPPSRVGIHNGELRMSLRTVRQAVLALVATAVLSAAAIAARPIDQLLRGEEYSGAIAAQLVFALVIVGLAAFALNNVKPLFDFSDLARRTEPSLAAGEATTEAAPASNSDGASALSWRAIVRRPGVTEALFSGVGFGLFFVFISRSNEIAGPWPLVSARAVSVMMFTLIALAASTALLPEGRSRMPLVLAGLLDAAAAVFFVMSTRTGLLSVGAALAALYPVVTVLLARIITKERIRPQQMAGLGLALCAVGLLAI